MLMFDGCEPGANPWVEKYFHDCVRDYRDAVGFTLGLCSIFVWLTAQMPQFVSNIKNQSSEALSIWFLVEWFAGDTLNLLGCLIQGQQLPTTTILAAYFVLMDVIMLLQFIYYGALQARRRRLRAKTSRRRHGHRRGSASVHHHQAVPLLQDGRLNLDLSDPSSLFETSSALPTPAEDRSIGHDLQDGTAGSGEASVHAHPLRTLTAAAAAGVSLICVAALALHPGASPSPSSRPGSLGRHLLYSSELHHHGPEALLGGNDGFFGPDVRNSGTVGRSSPAAAAAATTLGVAAAGTGAAFAGSLLSGGGRSLAVALYPSTAAEAAGTLLRSDGGGSGSNGGDGRGSSTACSFLNCDVALVAGTAMGYLSTCFYLASRVSQIRKNLFRKSTEGLSPVMFLLTISANLCTGISIVLRLRSVEQMKEQLPWMCGTFGTIALDMTLFYQAMTLGQGQHGHSHGHHHHHNHHHQHGQGHGQGHTPYGNGVGNGHDVAIGRQREGGGEGGGDGKQQLDVEAPLLLNGGGS